MNRRIFLRAGSSGLLAIQPVGYLFAQKATGSDHIQQLDTPYGGLILKDLSLTLQDQTIYGVVTNHTDRAWRWLSFLLRMRDTSGRLIPHDDGFDGHFYVKDLGKGESKQITDRKGEPARLLLRPSGYPATVEAEFILDRSYFDSRYVFSLISPRPSKELTYQDEWLNIRFVPGKQAPKVIEAGTSFESSLYPSDMVAGSRIFNDWRLSPLLPPSQLASHYRWRTFALLLPLEFGPRSSRLYQFTVRIEDVVI